MVGDKFKEDLEPTFPKDNIMCENCEFKKPGIIGYKNGYCSKYPRGKPNGILFREEKCKYYKKEQVSA